MRPGGRESLSGNVSLGDKVRVDQHLSWSVPEVGESVEATREFLGDGGRGRWHVQLIHSTRSQPLYLCWCSAGVRKILPSCIDSSEGGDGDGHVVDMVMQYMGLLG